MMHANQRAADLIGLLGPLVELLEEETALLRELRAPEIAALQTRKAALAESYRRGIAGATADPAFAATLDVPLRDQINALRERLRGAVVANAAALQAALKASQKLVASIAAAARDLQTAGAGYTRQGASGCQPGPTVAIRINQKL